MIHESGGGNNGQKQVLVANFPPRQIKTLYAMSNSNIIEIASLFRLSFGKTCNLKYYRYSLITMLMRI